MTELRITDGLDRPLRPGNIVLHIDRYSQPAGAWTIVETAYLDNGTRWQLKLHERGGPDEFTLSGEWSQGYCFAEEGGVLKLAEGEAGFYE